MKALAVAVLLIAVVGAFAWSLPHKIVGGSVVNKGDHAYQVHLGQKISLWGLYEYFSFGCGASIISDQWIVTAAHCITAGNDGSKYIVRVGQHDSSETESHAKNYAASQVIVHPGYNGRESFDNDIALIKIPLKLQFNDHVEAVALPPNGYKPAVGASVIVSGWGETKPNGRMSKTSANQYAKAASVLLQAVTVKVVSHEVCTAPNVYGDMVTENMVCAASLGSDSCQGDSGGPLVEENADGSRTLVGVVSFGIGCASEDYPGVYTKIGNYIAWINQHTGLGQL